MSQVARGTRSSRISPLSWIGAIAVHAVIAALLLQFGTEPAQSNVPPRPDVEAVRVQAADEELLEQRREAHRQALREEELRKQREREAKRKEAERKKAEKRKREEEARRKAAEKKKAEARAEVKRKAKEEAKRKLAEKRKREEAARRKAEEEKKRAAERAEAKRKAEEEARKLKEAEQRAEARRQEQAQRRQREAARRARQADIWRIAIKKRIERVWLRPPAAGNISPCEVVVEQDEKGVVLSAKVRGCRASQAWQDSLRNAVLKASPLPRPPIAELFDRHLVITFRPKAPR
ncbi:MAG: cell envelope integrity protein TolA [Gammaproteobacteria bacterium]|nr:cell envelope integrity protein TolA [Gammaproteobacteria bacterium]